MAKQSGEPMNIYQKMAIIGNAVEVVKKNKSGYGYNYVSDDEILSKINGKMKALGVSLIPNIIHQSRCVEPLPYKKTKVTKSGTTYEENNMDILVSADMEFHWVNNENPSERIVVPWMFVGQKSDASQALGAGLTYAARYFKLQYFKIADIDDDPDTFRSKQREEEEKERKEVAKAIIAEVDRTVNAHVEKFPDDRSRLVELVKKATAEVGKPSVNYNVITDPDVASRLLEAVKSLIDEQGKERNA